MKKILFVMPLMAISLLTSCGGNTSKKYFTVKFFDANDKVIQTIENVVSGSKVEFTGDIPTKESSEPSKKYKFRDWDKDINQPITEYTEFRPLYDDVNLFKVTFLDYDGTILKGGDAIPYYVEENTKPEAPNDPSREKIEGITYNFAGWDPEVKEISGPTTYTAKYTESYETYNVTFSIPDGAVLYENDVQTVIYNGLATRPKVTPYRPGYSFEGWFSDIDLTDPFDFETKHIKGTTTIYSKWEIDAKFAVPLCFTSNADGNTILTRQGFYYKTDLNGAWVPGDDTTSLTFNTGNKVYIGSDAAYTPDYYNFSLPSGSFNASGNIMSLVNHTDFKFLYEVGKKQFYNLFRGYTGKPSYVVDASSLLLPATKLADGCYECMFQFAEMLVKAPKLPAITLAYECYYSMFWMCTSLAEAPELPATTLAEDCYEQMFEYCPFTKAPELPATTLADGCYYYMFSYCPNLIEAPELPAITLTAESYFCMFYNCEKLNYVKVGFGGGTDEWPEAYDCTYRWLKGVSATGTFVWRGSLEGPSKGRSENTVPEGWTIETY